MRKSYERWPYLTVILWLTVFAVAYWQVAGSAAPWRQASALLLIAVSCWRIIKVIRWLDRQ